MCIWKWCVEGWVIVSLVALFIFIVFVRGCSDYNADDNKQMAETELAKIKAGLVECPVRINSNRTIWVKDCKAHMETITKLNK